MILDKVNEDILNQEAKIAEEIFGTKDNPDQILIGPETRKKLKEFKEGYILHEIIDGKPVCWALFFPTTKELMGRFLKKEINERELFNLTDTKGKFEALYLCSIITVPEYRGKGYALELMEAIINKFGKDEDITFFTWPTSKEGSELIKKLSQKISRKILLRE